MTQAQKFDVVVIGGGSGLTVAYFAGKDGKSVALIEAKPEALGGTCVNRGCIPTKGLIQSAEVMQTIRQAADFGIELDQASVRADFSRIMGTIRERRASDAAAVKSWVDEAFTPFYQRARFVDECLLETEDGTLITGERIFIASGAQPAEPPIQGLAGVSYLTNETALELETQPESLIILGGGYIGCEFGHFFSSLGTRTTMLARSGCLTGEDEDVRDIFATEFAKQAEIVAGGEPTEIGQNGGLVEVLIENGGNGSRTLRAEALLVATGRKPNTDGLALEKTGVETHAKGWVQVDQQLRTGHPRIFAYGDVIGQAMFKHTSSYEGELAYQNAHGAGRAVSYRANPHAVFSHPQIGSVGMTERQCQDAGLRYKRAKNSFDSVAKGRILGGPPGFAKLLIEEGTDRILGFHIVGPNAADLVHEVVVAMNAGDGTAETIRRSIHIHPTMPELIRAVSDQTG